MTKGTLSHEEYTDAPVNQRRTRRLFKKEPPHVAISNFSLTLMYNVQTNFRLKRTFRQINK